MVISKEVVAIVSSVVAVLYLLNTEFIYCCKIYKEEPNLYYIKRRKKISSTNSVESEHGRESSPETKA